MDQVIDLIFTSRQWIRLDIFIGFALYSILYFIARPFYKDKTFLKSVDDSAIKVVIYGGVVWFLLYVLELILEYKRLIHPHEQSNYLNEIFGKYAFYYLAQPIFWLLLTQLLRFKSIRRYLILRLIVAALFVITLERIFLFVTWFHRDYLPSDHQVYGINRTVGFGWAALNYMIKALQFVFLIFFVHVIKSLFKSWK